MLFVFRYAQSRCVNTFDTIFKLIWWLWTFAETHVYISRVSHIYSININFTFVRKWKSFSRFVFLLLLSCKWMNDDGRIVYRYDQMFQTILTENDVMDVELLVMFFFSFVVVFVCLNRCVLSCTNFLIYLHYSIFKRN